MDTPRISIENFKGISHLELDVKPFTVLIGPQSVGKSVTAKLLFYFQSFVDEAFVAAIGREHSIESILLERFGKWLPEAPRERGKSTIRYFVAGERFSLTHNGQADSAWEISLPKFFVDEFRKISKKLSYATKLFSGDDLIITVLRDQFHRRIEHRLGAPALYNPRFLPAGRSFYAQVERDAVSFFESATLDPFLAVFGKYWAHAKESPSRPAPQANPLATMLAESVLSGKYEREGQKDYINVQDGPKLPSALWSSGQQESLPLVFILQGYSSGHLKAGPPGTCLFIEEPEAHLFPVSQRRIIELISLAFNSSKPELNLFVTTHSPYVLSTLNVLLKAGQVFEKEKSPANRARISKAVPRVEALAPGSLGAYYMDQRGCRSIIDDETGLIDGRAIDDVSGDLAEQFDALDEAQ